ncbi:hypothetical protein H4582DRAFT_2085196 [Lactarius indigo]|nr:hypothetical protein H4582DRAFT_2085196 [Lactarius indigo]
MSHLNSRPSNKNKHPGVVDLSLQRCTHGQKKADEEKTAEEKQAREETQKAGIRQLAEVEERDKQTLNTLMGPGPGPRATNKWKRLETGSNVAAATRMGTGAEKNGPPVIKDKAAGSNDAVNMGSNVDREEEKQGKVKKTRAERAMYRNEVEAEKTQGQSDAGNEDDESVLNLPTPHYPQKPNMSDIIEVFSSQRDSPGSNSSFTSNKATENLSAFPSLNETHGIDDADVDMVDPPPSHSYYNNNNNNSDMDQGHYILDTPEDAQFGLLVPPSLMSTDTDSLTGAMARAIGKRDHVQTRAEHWPTALGRSSAPHIVKSEPSKKATNKDLPLGAHPAFRHDVVPTIWHWAGGKVHDPFNIDEHDLVKALAVIWHHVYTNMLFEIPMTVSLINQRISEWRNSFTSAATSSIISFFSSDDHYLQYDARVAFAQDMMRHYCFLFSDSFSDNNDEWTGMWCGPLFLQVFASQFNATTSRVVVQELDSETQGYVGAMALAATALERTLTLLVNGEIDIKLVIEDKHHVLDLNGTIVNLAGPTPIPPKKMTKEMGCLRSYSIERSRPELRICGVDG